MSAVNIPIDETRFEPLRSADLPPLPKIKQMAMLVEVRNYVQLDLYAQIILRSCPDDRHAHLACAWVASYFGISEQYHQHLRCVELGSAKKSSIQESSAKNSTKQSNSRTLEQLCYDLKIAADELVAPKPIETYQPQTKHERYHLIKAWGFGFGSEMSALMGQAYIAEACGRTPIVHWGSNFLYRPSGGDNCVFDLFFEPFNGLSINHTANLLDDCYPNKWNSKTIKMEHLKKKTGEQGKQSALHLLPRQERLTVADYYSGLINSMPWVSSKSPLSHLSFDDAHRYLAKKYLRPRADIVEEVERFLKQHSPQPFIAVHARGSDKDEGYRALTSIPNLTLECAKQRLADMPDGTKLFLMTDDNTLLRRYQSEFGERLFIADCQRSESEVGVHYDSETDKAQAGREMLIDMLIAAKAQCFIGLGLSNPSQLIRYFGDFSDENYILYGENRLKQFNTHLYQTISVV